jgi:hypothetical protein
MIQNGKEIVVLYLEDWQKRMIKDFLGVDCNSWNMSIDDSLKMLYAPAFPHKEIINKRMYLTEWQMRELRDEAGITCDFIELTKEASIVMYGPPFE